MKNTMQNFNHTTTFEQFKEMLAEDLRLQQVGKKKSKYSTIMNLKETI